MSKNEPIAIYLKEIDKTSLLSRKEEHYYLENAQKGDAKARELLIKSNLKLVVKIAKFYQNKGLSFLDLISEGNIGLIKSVEKFDTINYKNKFSTYSSCWIKEGIIKALADQSRTMRIPIYMLEKIRAINKMKEESNGLPFHKQVEKISKVLKIPKERIKYLLDLDKQEIVSLDAPTNDNGDNLYESIESNIKSPEKISLENKLKDDINGLLKTLNKRDSKIIYNFFGLDYSGEQKLKEIGKKMNLSSERIRQLKERTLKKLKNRGKMLKEYLYL